MILEILWWSVIGIIALIFILAAYTFYKDNNK